jgi:putative addiction module antidote
MELKLVKMGNSVGMVLPKAVRARMKLISGDAVYLTETPDGYEITPYDPEFGRQMETARKVMKTRRAALHELAK